MPSVQQERVYLICDHLCISQQHTKVKLSASEAVLEGIPNIMHHIRKGRRKSKGKLSQLHACASAEPLSKCQVLTGLVRTGEALKDDPEKRGKKKKNRRHYYKIRSPFSFSACCLTGLDPKPTKVKEIFHWLLKPNSEADQMPGEVTFYFQTLHFWTGLQMLPLGGLFCITAF